MTFHIGLTSVDVSVWPPPKRFCGKLGPDYFGQSCARMFWLWPVSVIVLTAA